MIKMIPILVVLNLLVSLIACNPANSPSAKTNETKNTNEKMAASASAELVQEKSKKNALEVEPGNIESDNKSIDLNIDVNEAEVNKAGLKDNYENQKKDTKTSTVKEQPQSLGNKAQTSDSQNKSSAASKGGALIEKQVAEYDSKLEKFKEDLSATVNEQEVVKNSEPTEEVPAVKKATFSHDILNQLLSTHVSSSGVVDYAGLKKDMAKLDEYLASVRATPASKEWSKNKQLAYWINAYNGHTLKLVVDNFPISSIKDLEGGEPWDKKWIEIGDQTLSLNNIENDIIRPQFNDPRIHFAVNCAAKSCPRLANFAFSEKNLDSELDEMTRSFINSSANKISAGSVSLSQVFEWYASDFGDMVTFLNKYSKTKIDPGAEIKHLEYDWSLNGK